MKHLSRWARQNPMPARFLIALCHLLISANAIWLGTQLFTLNWGKSTLLLPFSAFFFFLAYLYYPKREKKKLNAHRAYLRQKLHDFSLVLFYFIITATGVNNILLEIPQEDPSPTNYAAVFMAIRTNPNTTDSPSMHPFKFGIREHINVFTKWIKQEIREFKQILEQDKNKKNEKSGKVILIMFTIILGLILMVLITGWACDLSCSGNPGLANVVIFLGWAGVVLLCTFLIRKIMKRKDAKPETEQGSLGDHKPFAKNLFIS